MPAIKVSGGWKIRRSGGGLYPKVYPTLEAAKKRIAQMEAFKHLKAKKGYSREAVRIARASLGGKR